MPGTMNRLKLPSLGCCTANVPCPRFGLGGPLNTSEKHSRVLVGLSGTKDGFRLLTAYSVMSATCILPTLNENFEPMLSCHCARVIRPSGSASAAFGIGNPIPVPSLIFSSWFFCAIATLARAPGIIADTPMLLATRRKLRREISILIPFGLSVVVPRSLTAGVSGVLKVYGFIGNYTTKSGNFGHSSIASTACNRFQAGAQRVQFVNTQTRLLRLGTTVRRCWLDLNNRPESRGAECKRTSKRSPTFRWIQEDRVGFAAGRLELNDPPASAGGSSLDISPGLDAASGSHAASSASSTDTGRLSRRYATRNHSLSAIPGLERPGYIHNAATRRSTSFRWWDSGGTRSRCRLELNDPPASAGGSSLDISPGLDAASGSHVASSASSRDTGRLSRRYATRNHSLPAIPGLERPGYIHNAATRRSAV